MTFYHTRQSVSGQETEFSAPLPQNYADDEQGDNTDCAYGRMM